MDSITSGTTTAPTWPCSYHGVGFLIVQQEDEMFQGIVQGGYHTPPCFLSGQALQLVTEYIDQHQGDH
jgi:hypothetical protein